MRNTSQSSLRSPSTLRVQPRLHILNLRVHAPQLTHIRLIPIRSKPRNHEPQLRNHVHQRASQETVRRNRITARRILKRPLHTRKVQLFTRKPQRFVVHLLGVLERMRSKPANIGRRDVLDALPLQRVPECGQEHLTWEPRCQVIEESHGPEDRPAHTSRILLQMLFNLKLCLEVRNRCLVLPAGLVAAALDAGVDEMADVVLDTFIDEVVALLDFAGGGDALAHGDLDGVDAPDGFVGEDGGGGGEDAGDVVEIALDEVDGGGFGGELLGGGGGRVAGYWGWRLVGW